MNRANTNSIHKTFIEKTIVSINYLISYDILPIFFFFFFFLIFHRVECFPFDDHNSPPLDLIDKYVPSNNAGNILFVI